MRKNIKKLIAGCLAVVMVLSVLEFSTLNVSAASYGVQTVTNKDLENSYSSGTSLNPLKGIDVSKWQGTIDWAKVKNYGVEFAIIQAGYRDQYTGELMEDPSFTENAEGASAEELPIGLYFLSQAITVEEAIEEADWLIDKAKSYEISFPLVMDFEYKSNSEGYTGRLYEADLSVDEATEIVDAFCGRIEEAGYSAMLYANTYMMTKQMNVDTISSKYKIWLANYQSPALTTYGNPTTVYPNAFTCFQFSYTGEVDGISTAVDLDYWYEERVKPEVYANIKYRTHVQDVGWQDWVSSGETAGTSGQSKRLEGLNISVDSNLTGSVLYRTHVQNIGWQDWVSDGQLSGTSGKSLRLEAVQIRLTDELAENYDVYYRVHAQNIGWMDWAKNGESAGTEGCSFRLEAIEVVLVEKGGAAPGDMEDAFRRLSVSVQTHIQNIGWQDPVGNNGIAGTFGQSLRMEGVKISTSGFSGGITYRTHVQNIGWQDWESNGALSGTSGRSLRLEAIQIKLTGEMDKYFDVYYRVHAQNIGWMGWTKNGASAGTEGYSYRLEAIQIKIVLKDEVISGSTANAFRKKK